MILHRYLIRFTIYKLVEALKNAGQSFGLPSLEHIAKEKNVCFEKEVKAFTAEDALVQLRAAEGGSLGQPPFVFAIEPLPDAPPESGSRDPWLSFPVTDEEAKCACGTVAVQWRKDTPICAKPECLTKATSRGK